MTKRLKGRTAIVTGAANGIGRSIASLFAKEGANVVIADIDDRAGITVKNHLSKEGFQSEFIKADVSSGDDMKKLADTTYSKFKRIDILCSNAGIFPSSRVEDMDEDEWDRVHSVNLKGTFLTVKSCFPYMKEQNYGKVVVTSSITGPITGFPGWAHYGATKSGINGFIRTAAIEFAKDNITINAVMPGNIMTEGMEAVGEEYIRQTESCIPMARLGDPEDVAYAALFFSTDESRYITGQTIIVDGGQTLPESILATN